MAPPSANAELALEPVGEYDEPVYVTSDPDDADRLFIVEKKGRIRLTADGRTSTFLDQRGITNTDGWERGLLSMAFAPDFAETGRFYVFYTDAEDGSVRVDELLADGNAAHPESRRHVLRVRHPQDTHNGGQLAFGPDGYLYVSIGDGGAEEDEYRNGQDPTTLLGTLLRIDPRQSGADPYTVPPDNPFVGTENADEIWSWGLRNPWRFSFDRETGALTIADVGSSWREELNYRPQEVGGGRGDNFGWSCREGFLDWPPEAPECDAAEMEDLVDPVLDYPNSAQYVTEDDLEAEGATGDPYCAIVGGYVVRDPALIGLEGRYLYSDLCRGDVRSAALDLPLASEDCSEGLIVPGPSSFGEDANGRIYIASLQGPVGRLVGESERSDCVEVTGPPDEGGVPLIVALLGGGALALVAGGLVLGRRRLIDWTDLDSRERRSRMAGGVVVAAGVLVALVAVLSVALGLADSGYGWRRVALLAVGGVIAAIGGAVIARPRLISRHLRFPTPVGPVEHRGKVALLGAGLTLLAALAIALMDGDVGIPLALAAAVFVGLGAVAFLVYPHLAVAGTVVLFALIPALEVFVWEDFGAVKDLVVVAAVSAAVVVGAFGRRWPDRWVLGLVGAVLVLYAVNIGREHDVAWAHGVRLTAEPLLLLLVGLTLPAPLRTLRYAIGALVAMGCAITLYGIVQQIVGDVTLASWGYDWNAQLRLIHGGPLRSFGTLDDPFAYAAFLLMGLAAIVFWMRRGLLAWGAGALLLVGVGISFVRTAALVVVAFVGLVLARRGRTTLVLVAAAVALGAGALVAAINGPEETGNAVLDDRVSVWGDALTDDPVEWVVGRGVGEVGTAAERATFGISPAEERLDVEERDFVDSGYIATIADVGLIGLALLLALFARLAVLAAGAARSGKDAGWLALALLAALLIDALTRDSFTGFPTGFLALLLIGTALAAAGEERAQT